MHTDPPFPVPPLRLLLIHDNPAEAKLFQDQLCTPGPAWCVLSHAPNLDAGIDIVTSEGGSLDGVVLALSRPDAPGFEAIARLRTTAPKLALVVVTGHDDETAALRAAQGGAQDYLVRDRVAGPLLGRAIRYAIERKRAQEAERSAIADAQTTQLREQFVAVLGHDLRNPLSSITMSAGLLLKNPDMGERQLRAARRIASSAERMNRMVRDLLDFTRVRLGSGYSLNVTPGSLRDICKKAVEELDTTHQTRSIIFNADQRCWGEWDAERMAQVASNLIHNGLEYSAPETSVQVTLREDEREAALPITLEVTNQGPAVPPELIPAIFEPFRRVQIHQQTNATGSAANGLGLGLYIAHQIVLAHHGRITVRSTAVEGTTLSVKLPRSQRRG